MKTMSLTARAHNKEIGNLNYNETSNKRDNVLTSSEVGVFVRLDTW